MDRQCLGQAPPAHGVELLVQFGSTVTDATHARSDVDLVVLLTRVPESYDQEADLQAALQSCVEDREVDLVVVNRADVAAPTGDGEGPPAFPRPEPMAGVTRSSATRITDGSWRWSASTRRHDGPAMTVDPALVTRKLLLIAADFDALRPVAERGLDAYLASRVEQAFVERYLEQSIGRMIHVPRYLDRVNSSLRDRSNTEQ